MSDRDWMLVEFKGTYTIANPNGVKGSKVVRPFHVKVEMKKSFLDFKGPTGITSLRGPFATYYKQELRKADPGMIDLAQFDMVEATELDGTPIDDPNAMSHENLLDYIQRKRYPINPGLWNDQDLRHEVARYEADPKGQQKGQAHLTNVRGAFLDIAKEISSRGSKMVFLPVENEQLQKVQKAQIALDTKVPPKSTKEHAKVAIQSAKLDDLFGEEPKDEGSIK